MRETVLAIEPPEEPRGFARFSEATSVSIVRETIQADQPFEETLDFAQRRQGVQMQSLQPTV